MKNILSDMRKVILLFDKLFKKDIKINKTEFLSDRLITITFSYKNKQDLNKMFFAYSDFMEVFLNPLEINLKK